MYGQSLIVDDLLAVLDAEGTQSVIAWGSSLGAKDAACLAERAPDRVRALVYGSGPALTRPDESREQYVALAEQVSTSEGLVRAWASFGFSEAAAVSDALGRNDVAALTATLSGTVDYWPRPERILAPSLWYAGEAEGGFYDDEVQFAEEHGIELHVVSGADHFGAFSHSADVLSFVEPFLAQHR